MNMVQPCQQHRSHRLTQNHITNRRTGRHYQYTSTPLKKDNNITITQQQQQQQRGGTPNSPPLALPCPPSPTPSSPPSADDDSDKKLSDDVTVTLASLDKGDEGRIGDRGMSTRR